MILSNIRSKYELYIDIWIHRDAKYYLVSKKLLPILYSSKLLTTSWTHSIAAVYLYGNSRDGVGANPLLHVQTRKHFDQQLLKISWVTNPGHIISLNYPLSIFASSYIKMHLKSKQSFLQVNMIPVHTNNVFVYKNICNLGNDIHIKRNNTMMLWKFCSRFFNGNFFNGDIRPLTLT